MVQGSCFVAAASSPCIQHQADYSIETASIALYRIDRTQPSAQGVRVTEVPLSVDSLNSGDVFILDLGPKIIVWAGSAATGMEKNKALTYTIALRDDRDHKGIAQVRHTYHLAKLSPDDKEPMTLLLPYKAAETTTVQLIARTYEAVVWSMG